MKFGLLRFYAFTHMAHATYLGTVTCLSSLSISCTGLLDFGVSSSLKSLQFRKFTLSEIAKLVFAGNADR